MILPALLLFGVSFGDTWSYSFDSYPTINYSAARDKAMYFDVIWSNWNTLKLYSMDLLWSWNTCPYRKIFSAVYWSITPIAEWPISTTWTTTLQTVYPNIDLAPWRYAINIDGDNSLCNSYRMKTNEYVAWNVWKYDYPTLLTTMYNSSANIISFFLWTPIQTISADWWWVAWLVFSWTDPRLPAPITIHYNWIFTWYTGTELYIDQPVKDTYMSWGFLHFVIQQFRALFRSH